jgi:tellurite resistance protein TerC
MSVPLWGWFAAVGLILVLLAVDIIVNRGNVEPTIRRALIASAAWIAMSIAFGVFLGPTGSDYVSGVSEGRYEEWVVEIDQTFQEQDPRGTPAALLDGER